MCVERFQSGTGKSSVYSVPSITGYPPSLIKAVLQLSGMTCECTSILKEASTSYVALQVAAIAPKRVAYESLEGIF